MKTKMQELIEWCNSCLTDLTLSDGAKTALEVTIVRATDLLEKEKEQIEHAHAHLRCLHNKTMDCTIEAYKNAEKYYNQTYKQ